MNSRLEIILGALAATAVIGVPAASGASILQNYEFVGTLVPWIVEGVAENTGDTAVFTDVAGSRVAVFQTAAVPTGFAGFRLSLDFIGGLSAVVTPGFLLDTFFATLYLGLNDFGGSIAGGDFDQAIELFSADANGVFNVAAGGIFGPSPKGAGWSRFTLDRLTAPGFTDPGFATVAFEFFSLNGISDDSVAAVDNVQLLAAVPEPGSCMFLALAAAIVGSSRRRSGTVSSCGGFHPGKEFFATPPKYFGRKGRQP